MLQNQIRLNQIKNIWFLTIITLFSQSLVLSVVISMASCTLPHQSPQSNLFLVKPQSNLISFFVNSQILTVFFLVEVKSYQLTLIKVAHRRGLKPNKRKEKKCYAVVPFQSEYGLQTKKIFGNMDLNNWEAAIEKSFFFLINKIGGSNKYEKYYNFGKNNYSSNRKY